MLSVAYFEDPPWLNPIIHRREFLGVDHNGSLKMLELIERRSTSPLSTLFQNLIKSVGVAQALAQLHLACSLLSEKNLYKSQEAAMWVLGVPEFDTVDVPLDGFFISLRQEIDSGKTLHDAAVELGMRYLDQQLARKDTHLLSDRIASVKCLNSQWQEVERIRVGEAKSISITMASKSSSRFGMYNLQSAFQSAVGFEALTRSCIGPWANQESAQTALEVLTRANLVPVHTVLPSKPEDDRGESAAPPDGYLHLFSGYSEPKKRLLNAVMQSLDPDIQTSIAGYQSIDTMFHRIWREPLMAGCKSNDARIVEASVKGLGILNDPTCVKTIEAHLKHESTGVRDAAITSLSSIGAEESIDALLQLGLQGGEDHASSQCIEALSHFQSERAVQAMTKLIRVVYAPLRSYWVSWLGGTRQWSAFPLALESFFDDELAHRNLKVPEETDQILQRVLPLVGAALRKMDVSEQISRFGELAIDPLVHMICTLTGREVPHKKGESEYPLLIRHVEDRVRASGLTMRTSVPIAHPLVLAISALGGIPSPRSIEALLGIALTVDERFRNYVLVGLTKQGIPAYPKLMAMLDSGDEPESMYEALSYFNLEEANQALLKGLKADKESIRTAAALAMAYRRNPRYIAELDKVVTDLPPDVLKRVTERLGEFPIPESMALKKRIEEILRTAERTPPMRSSGRNLREFPPESEDGRTAPAAVQKELRPPEEKEESLTHPDRFKGKPVSEARKSTQAEPGPKPVIIDFDKLDTTQRLLIMMALQAEEKKQYADAVRGYELLLKQYPRLREIWSYYAGALLLMGKPKEAVSAYRKAVEFFPDVPGVWFGLGFALAQIGEFVEAEKCLREALKLHPQYPAWETLGAVYLATERYREAIAALNVSLESSPDNVQALSQLGQAYWRCGMLDEALDSFRRVTELAPENVEAWSAIGQILEQKGNISLAIETLTKAIGLHPGDERLCSVLSGIYIGDKQYQDAEALLNNGLEKNAHSAMLHYWAGILYTRENNKDPKRAQHHFSKAYGLQPDDPHSLYGMALMNSERREWETALRFMERVLVKVPRSGEMWAFRSGILMSLGRVDEAESSARKGIELNPERMYCHMAMSSFLNRARRFDEAEAVVRKTMADFPVQGEMFASLGYIFAVTGKLEQSEEACRKAIELEPGGKGGWDNLGLCLLKKGEYEGSVGAFLKALEIEPDYPPALVGLSSAYAALGKDKESKKALEQARRIDSMEVQRLLVDYK